MLTIAAVKNSPGRERPYTQILRVKIIKKGKKVDNKKHECAVADHTGCTKVIAQDDEQFKKLAAGKTVLLRNFTLGRRYILLNKSTVISRSTDLEVPAPVEEEAQGLVDPATPPTSTVEEVIHQGLNGDNVTIVGTIVADETPKDVHAGTRPTQVRNMVIKDSTGQITVALWQHFATSPVKTGDRIKLTHLKRKNNSYHRRLQLSTTPNTQVEVQEPDLKLHFATFLGIECVKDDIFTLAVTISDNYKMVTASKEVIQQIFGTTVEDRLLEEFSIKGEFEIFLKGTELQMPI